MTTQFPLSGPLSVGGLLVRALRLYRARFSVFLLTAAILLLPKGIVPSVGTMFGEGSSFPLLVPGAIFYLFSSATPGFTNLAPVLMFPVAYILAALVFTIQSNRMLHGRPLAAREVLREGLGCLRPYAATTITKWVVVVIAIVVAFFCGFFWVLIVGGTLEEVTPSSSMYPESPTLSTKARHYGGWFFVWILPTVLFGAMPVSILARMFVAPAALVVERTGQLESFQRSWELSEGSSWRMMGYVMLLFLLLRLFNYAPATVFQLAIPRFLPGLDLGLQSGIAIALHSVMSTISAPAAICTTVLLYYDLRIRNEGYDLELRLADMEEQVGRDAGERAP